MPNAAPSGTMSGTTTNVAEKMSISIPTISRKMFRASRNTNGDLMYCGAASTRREGTCASTRYAVSPTATPRMMRTPPTVATQLENTRLKSPTTDSSRLRPICTMKA